MTPSFSRELSLDLTDDEFAALDITWALGPHWVPPSERSTMYRKDYAEDPSLEASDTAEGTLLAHRLGFADEAQLERESERLGDAIRDRRPLTRGDWKRAIELMSRLMSPADREWETVVGLTYLETATHLDAVWKKMIAAFKERS